jgi:hypothetical protein
MIESMTPEVEFVDVIATFLSSAGSLLSAVLASAMESAKPLTMVE